MASYWSPQVRWDGDKPYITYIDNGVETGKRQYITPASVSPSNDYGKDPKLLAWAERNQRPGQSLTKNAGRWNNDTGNWDQDFNWTNALNIGTGALIGAPYLAGAGGGGAAPAAGGGTTMVAPGIPAVAGTGGTALIAPGAVAPIAGAATAGVGVLDKLKKALTSGDGIGALAGLAPLIAGAAGGFGGGNQGNNPDLARILALNEAQMRRADPLHQAAVQLAFGNLPTYARDGISLPRVDLPK